MKSSFQVILTVSKSLDENIRFKLIENIYN